MLLREPRSNGAVSCTQKSRIITVRNYFLRYDRAVRKFIHLTNTGNKRENLPKQKAREKEAKASVSNLHSPHYIWISRRHTTSTTLLECRGRRSPRVIWIRNGPQRMKKDVGVDELTTSWADNSKKFSTTQRECDMQTKEGWGNCWVM